MTSNRTVGFNGVAAGLGGGYLALRKAGVAAEMHIFEKGAHGVGLANDDAALSEWSKLMANWLRVRGVIK